MARPDQLASLHSDPLLYISFSSAIFTNVIPKVLSSLLLIAENPVAAADRIERESRTIKVEDRRATLKCHQQRRPIVCLRISRNGDRIALLWAVN